MENAPDYHGLSFHATHYVLIHKDKYIAGLRNRIQDNGRGAALNDDMYIDESAILRHVLISAVLVGQPLFKIGPNYEFDRNAGRYRLRGYSPRLGSPGTYFVRPGFIARPIRAAELRRTSGILDRYYRSGRWWEDRMGSALAHFWDAICTPHHDHSYLGLTMTLEAALSTTSMEVTHQLAEHVAVVLHRRPGADRYDMYEKVREIYGVRSKIVHGRAGPRKKGKILSNSLAVMARRVQIPLDLSEQLLQITIGVLGSLLKDREYLTIIHENGTDETASKKIGSLMRARLLRG